MRTTIPLIITATVGFVLIVAHFIPATVTWGETAMVWFDILAAIAFVLGGGNLLMSHLKKISDQVPGWGYSAITIVAFLVTLGVGLPKLNSRPQPKQEFYGESFAPLPPAAFPESEVARVEGTIPRRATETELPPSVRGQLREADGALVFRGWMSGNQKQDLLGYQDLLEWQCAVEKLYDAAQPPEELAGKVVHHADHGTLGWKGEMTEEQRDELNGLGEDARWERAVTTLFERSRRETTLKVSAVPEDFEVPESLSDSLEYDAEAGRLVMTGPMSASQRDALAAQFPRVKPFDEGRTEEFFGELEAGGELNEKQRAAIRTVLSGVWTVEQLHSAIDAAGVAKEKEKTACELLAEREAGETVLETKKEAGEDVALNAAQVGALQEYADEPGSPEADEVIERLDAAGPLTDGQKGEIREFLGAVPTVGELRKAAYMAAVKEGPLTTAQGKFLLDDVQKQVAWEATVNRLFRAAHVVKYPWSGEYRGEGTPFGWIYEYVFKPLTATMFSLLAFYVASAAFRAFRAKNLDAILLLGTAFVILLGRTFAGVWLTSWLPADSPFRIENMTVFIMSVMNTAGNRAIMIGIALGIASTSLKVLLGIDRSYLGSEED